LGEPGSKNRNPLIAAIFHETNLAETKGTGIRTMRKLMEQANMVPPTFESDHSANLFTARLLLHHFLSEDDIIWLHNFQDFELNDAQKRALIFAREVGAIDNPSYRQLNGCDSLKASGELRNLRDLGILSQKGKGRATYYVPDLAFYNPEMGRIIPDPVLSDKSGALPDNPKSLPDNPSTLVPGTSAPVPGISTPVPALSAPVPEGLVHHLPGELKELIDQLGKEQIERKMWKG